MCDGQGAGTNGLKTEKPDINVTWLRWSVINELSKTGTPLESAWRRRVFALGGSGPKDLDLFSGDGRNIGWLGLEMVKSIL